MVQKEKEEFIKKLKIMQGSKFETGLIASSYTNDVFISAKNSRPVLEPLFNYYQQDLQK